MPDYKFTSPAGKTIRVTGDTPPSESELDDIFKAAGAEPVTAPKLPTAADLAAAKTPAERVAILRPLVNDRLRDVLQLAHTWATRGPHAVVEGLKDLAGGEYAKGAHEVVSGAGITALPMVAVPLAAAAVAAPATTALMLGGGYVGSKLAESGALAMGATEDQTALAGDVGGIVGGGAGAMVPRIPIGAVRGAAAPIIRHGATAVGAAVGSKFGFEGAGIGAVIGRNIGNQLAERLGPAEAAAAVEAASATVAPHLDFSQRMQPGGMTQQQIGERLAAARASGVRVPMPERVTNPAQPVRVPLPPPPPPPPTPPIEPPPPPPVMRTGTSMQPAPMPTPRPIEAPTPVEPPPAPIEPSPVAPSVERPLEPISSFARVTKETQHQVWQEIFRAIKANPALKFSAIDMAALDQVVTQGHSPADAVGAMVKMKVRAMTGSPALPPPVSQSPVEPPPPVARPPVAPVEPPPAAPVPATPVVAPEPAAAPAAAPEPTASISAPRALNELAMAARRAKTTLSRDEYAALQPLVQQGTSADAAVAALVKTRVEAAPADPAAAEFAAKYNLPSDAERTFPPNKSGLPTKPPRADRQAQVTAPQNQYADIPAELVKPAAVKAGTVELSPEIEYALKWIQEDMESIPYTPRTVIDNPTLGQGGTRLGVGGAAGAKIYDRIVGEIESRIPKSQRASRPGRQQVINAIENIKAGKVTKVGQMVLDVAKEMSEMSIDKLQRLMATGPPTP